MIPADAFTYGPVNGFQPGQLLMSQGMWFLLTAMNDGGGDRHGALAMSGKLRGGLAVLRGHDQVFAISPAYRCHPLLAALPKPEEAKAGSLFFYQNGYAFRSWANGRIIYAFSASGEDITRDFPYDAVSVPVWSMGLFRQENPGVLIDTLFEVDANAVDAPG